VDLYIILCESLLFVYDDSGFLEIYFVLQSVDKGDEKVEPWIQLLLEFSETVEHTYTLLADDRKELKHSKIVIMEY